MKSKRFISLSILSVLSMGLLAGSIFYRTQTNNDATVSVEAWSIDVKPNVEVSYYSAADGKTGSALKSALAGFNNPKNKSYDWSRYEAADEAQDDSTSILCIYTRHNIKKNSHVGSYSWDTWNREHVYTQAAFPQSSTDNHNIFACEGLINNERGNKPYANLKGKGGTQVTVHGHVTDCYQTSSLFEPCDEAKGEVARACLYCTVYYGYSLSSIFDSIDTALEWNAKYTVTPREIYRNNVVYGLQGNRNPFVDHPSYAKAIYGGPDYEGDDPLSPKEPVSVTGVSLDKTSAALYIGETLQLTATVTPDDAANKKVTWSAEPYEMDELVVSVDGNGNVTALAEGTAKVVVTTVDGGYTASAIITVNKKKPAPKSTGCGGSIATTSVILSSLSILGLGLLLIKRRFHR